MQFKKSRGTISKDLTSQKIRHTNDFRHHCVSSPVHIITSSHHHQLTSSPLATLSGSAQRKCCVIARFDRQMRLVACAACWPQRVDVKTISSCKCSVRPACRQDLLHFTTAMPSEALVFGKCMVTLCTETAGWK